MASRACFIGLNIRLFISIDVCTHNTLIGDGIDPGLEELIEYWGLDHSVLIGQLLQVLWDF